MPHDSAPTDRDREAASPDTTAVAAFLRVLATHVERDSEFAHQVQEALQASGLQAPSKASGSRGRQQDRPPRAQGGAPGASPPAPASATSLPDPFGVLRTVGEDGLRGLLAGLEVAALRQIVRVHRLDPARISARWTSRERLATLIVQQARARADHGKAFSRV